MQPPPGYEQLPAIAGPPQNQCMMRDPLKWARDFTRMRTTWAAVSSQCRGFGTSSFDGSREFNLTPQAADEGNRYYNFTKRNRRLLMDSQVIMANLHVDPTKGETVPEGRRWDFEKDRLDAIFVNGEPEELVADLEKVCAANSQSAQCRAARFGRAHTNWTYDEFDKIRRLGKLEYCKQNVAQYNLVMNMDPTTLQAYLAAQICNEAVATAGATAPVLPAAAAAPQGSNGGTQRPPRGSGGPSATTPRPASQGSAATPARPPGRAPATGTPGAASAPTVPRPGPSSPGVAAPPGSATPAAPPPPTVSGQPARPTPAASPSPPSVTQIPTPAGAQPIGASNANSATEFKPDRRIYYVCDSFANRARNAYQQIAFMDIYAKTCSSFGQYEPPAKRFREAVLQNRMFMTQWKPELERDLGNSRSIDQYYSSTIEARERARLQHFVPPTLNEEGRNNATRDYCTRNRNEFVRSIRAPAPDDRSRLESMVCP